MEINAAFVREQGITFAVVLVELYVINSPSQSSELIRQLHTIRDFQNIPVVLAAETGGRGLYRGCSDIVNFLSNYPLGNLPWGRYRLN